MRIALADDEPLSLEYLANILAAVEAGEVVGQFKNGLEVLKALESGLVIDLLFLDIEMPVIDGFQVVERLQGDNLPLIVFATAFDAYALKAFELNAVDYILKPFAKTRVLDAVQRSRDRLQALALVEEQETVVDRADIKGAMLQAVTQVRSASDSVENSDSEHPRFEIDRLVIKDRGKALLIEFDTIDWVDAAGDYMCVHVAGDTFIMRSTMKELELKLPSDFERIHRSTIVNLQKVQAIDSLPKGESLIYLKDEVALKVSRNFNARIRQLLKNSNSP